MAYTKDNLIGVWKQVDNIMHDRHLGNIYGVTYPPNSTFKKLPVNVVIHPWYESNIQDTPWKNPHTLMWVVYEETTENQYRYTLANGYYTNGYFLNGVKCFAHVMVTPQIPRDSDGTRYYTWGRYLQNRDQFAGLQRPSAHALGLPELARGFFEVAVSDNDYSYNHSGSQSLETVNTIMWIQNGIDRTSEIDVDMLEPFLAINTMRWWVRIDGKYQLAGDKITTINTNENKKYNFILDVLSELPKDTPAEPGYASKLGLFKHGYWMYQTTWPTPLYAQDSETWYTYKYFRGVGDTIPWGAPDDNYDFTRVYPASGWTSIGYFQDGQPVEITDNIGLTPRYAPDTFKFYMFPNGFKATPDSYSTGILASGLYSTGAFANGQFCKNFNYSEPIAALDNFRLYTYQNGTAIPYQE